MLALDTHLYCEQLSRKLQPAAGSFCTATVLAVVLLVQQ